MSAIRRPWTQGLRFKDVVENTDGQRVCTCSSADNAELLVRAVNNFELMRDALDIIAKIGSSRAQQVAKATLRAVDDGAKIVTTVYVTRAVTGPDGEDVELELAADVSADGEVIGLSQVAFREGSCSGGSVTTINRGAVPEWALRQIDMGDLAEDALRALKAREKGWP